MEFNVTHNKTKRSKKRVLVFDFLKSSLIHFTKRSIESEDRFDVKVLKL